MIFISFNFHRKRENNRVKIQIIMQQQKPQERVVRLKQYQIEQDLFVVVDWV
jgi:hypothetical protein